MSTYLDTSYSYMYQRYIIHISKIHHTYIKDTSSISSCHTSNTYQRYIIHISILHHTSSKLTQTIPKTCPTHMSPLFHFFMFFFESSGLIRRQEQNYLKKRWSPPIRPLPDCVWIGCSVNKSKWITYQKAQLLLKLPSLKLTYPLSPNRKFSLPTIHFRAVSFREGQLVTCSFIYTPEVWQLAPWRMMVGRLVSFREGNFWGASCQTSILSKSKRCVALGTHEMDPLVSIGTIGCPAGTDRNSRSKVGDWPTEVRFHLYYV